MNKFSDSAELFRYKAKQQSGEEKMQSQAWWIIIDIWDVSVPSDKDIVLLWIFF